MYIRKNPLKELKESVRTQRRTQETRDETVNATIYFNMYDPENKKRRLSDGELLDAVDDDTVVYSEGLMELMGYLYEADTFEPSEYEISNSLVEANVSLHLHSVEDFIRNVSAYNSKEIKDELKTFTFGKRVMLLKYITVLMD